MVFLTLVCHYRRTVNVRYDKFVCKWFNKWCPAGTKGSQEDEHTHVRLETPEIGGIVPSQRTIRELSAKWCRARQP